ncbi:inovirus Gp2 family protein [Pectobacteriaceae bacterium CE90]|nr:inovirus Gp2 family protein [Pectobacteriaceae bacterium CE90]
MNPTYLYNSLYIDSVKRTLNAAVNQYPRLATFRFDLRFPLDGIGRNDEGNISRFFEAFKYHAETQFNTKRNAGITCDHPTAIRYIWCREYGDYNNNRHYHVMLMVNKDTFHTLGNYQPLLRSQFCSLANMIQKAWCSTIKLPWRQFFHLVHFPQQPCVWIERNKPDYVNQYTTAYERAMYLAKEATKRYGDGRSFGRSQGQPSVIGSRKHQPG